MSDNQKVLTKANLSNQFNLDTGDDKVKIAAANVDVTAATNITATTLIAALSEIGGRLDALES